MESQNNFIMEGLLLSLVKKLLPYFAITPVTLNTFFHDTLFSLFNLFPVHIIVGEFYEKDK